MKVNNNQLTEESTNMIRHPILGDDYQMFSEFYDFMLQVLPVEESNSEVILQSDNGMFLSKRGDSVSFFSRKEGRILLFKFKISVTNKHTFQ